MEQESTLRFRLRVGDVEVEAEGPEEFVKSVREYAERLVSDSLTRTKTWGAISSPRESSSSSTEPQPPVSIHAGQDLAKEESLVEFLERLPSKTHQDKILAFAYFIEKNRGIQSFGTKEINDCYSEAKESRTNTGVYFSILTKSGLIMPSKNQPTGGATQYTLTRKGEKTIKDALTVTRDS